MKPYPDEQCACEKWEDREGGNEWGVTHQHETERRGQLLERQKLNCKTKRPWELERQEASIESPRGVAKTKKERDLGLGLKKKELNI